ncbi:MAG: ATP-binding protein [Candidatus Methanomethylophilaceae archaeon]|uniref:ATP-binding protein n=1 Tax=Candidatus Methanarcanum hacksteinii TaxID=2911857 RepID=UPI002A7BA161|nr:ATP-binding protein [Candidatus Methanomethylophilaceae archaeon]MCI6024642.1 ATP-binding protein [Methanomassiliicoccales archaeon]
MQVLRKDYLSLLEAGKDENTVVKVITGMRRSGKSTLMNQFIEKLKAAGVSDDRIFLINFEMAEYQYINDRTILNKWILDNIPKEGQCYVFLDEIQNVNDWEMSVSALQIMPNCDVYITGSNSKMLSSELSTHISGRYTEVKVLPLSFSEYLELHPSDDKDSRFRDYLRYGGLPVVNPDSDRTFIEGLLEGIFNTVLVKDVLYRLKTDDVSKITAIAKFLYSNIGNITNIDNIATETGISNPTVSKYVEEMSKAFLFYYAEKYDIVGKKILKTNGKFYASDLGMRNVIIGLGLARDISKPLENVVFMELLRRGYEVRIGSYRDWEVDFTAIGPDGVEYYQICETMLSDDTYKRESRPFKAIKDNCPKTILTLDKFGLGSDDGIKIVNLVDWLLDKN